MTSLRLAEAFIRTAVPEGHEPLRDLAELRAHMDGTHQLGVAGMLPLQVLMHLHENVHQDEPEWHGSPDSSRSSGFTARRRHVASEMDDIHEGDSITLREQHARLISMREHFRGLGFPVQDRDRGGYENLATHFIIPDSGHSVGIGHSRKDQTWRAVIGHPDDKGRDQSVVHLNLGLNAEHVPHLLTRELGSSPVVDEMRRQWQRARSGQPEPENRWRNPDGSRWNPHAVHFTARGAQLPEDGGEDY
jgi:hypothetical protein